VKSDRDERNTQPKLQDTASAPAMQASDNDHASRKGGQKKKIKPGKMSHSATSGQRK